MLFILAAFALIVLIVRGAVSPFWHQIVIMFEDIAESRVLFSFSGGDCILYLVAYLPSYYEKAINALYKLAWELPAVCLPHQDGGIPLSAFANGTTSKLAGLFSTLSL